jgi:hypothetical protein
LHFRRLQQGLDAEVRSDRKLRESREDTMHLHDLLRTVFKILTLASLLFSLNNVGVPHLCARYGALALAIASVAAACGYGAAAVDWFLDCRFFWQQHQGAILHQMMMQQQQDPEEQLNLHGAGALVHAANGVANIHPPPQSAFTRFCARALDSIAMWGPPAVAANDDANNNNNAPGLLVHELAAVPVAEADDPAEVLRRKHLRRAALFIGLYACVEVANWLLDSHDPAWFTFTCISAFRLFPYGALMWAVLAVVLQGTPWRSREVLIGVGVAVGLEALFWSTGWRNELVVLLGKWWWRKSIDVVLPALWQGSKILVRIAPLGVAVPCFLWMLVQMSGEVLIMMADTIAPPPLQPNGVQVFNFNPAAQPWGQIFGLLVNDPNLRFCYKLSAASALVAVVAELLFSWLGVDLPFVRSLWSSLRAALPVLSSIAYEVAVFESRGALLGMAVARVLFVVHKSLPLRSLALLTKKSKTNARRSSSSGGDAGGASSSANAAGHASASGAAHTAASSLVCLSCARHRHPFRALRLLSDMLFETHLLCSYPFSGVQGLHLQKQELELQLVDTDTTLRLAREERRKIHAADEAAGAEGEGEGQSPHEPTVAAASTATTARLFPRDDVEDEEDDVGEGEDEDGSSSSSPSLFLQTCNRCVLHSIRMQLLLPFLFYLLVHGLFVLLFPPAPYSTYSAVLSHMLHFFFDRVPVLVVIDVALGWHKGRVLQHPRAYWAASAAVILYAWGSVMHAQWSEGSVRNILLPNFAAPYEKSSSLVLDAIWLVLWILN